MWWEIAFCYSYVSGHCCFGGFGCFYLCGAGAVGESGAVVGAGAVVVAAVVSVAVFCVVVPPPHDARARARVGMMIFFMVVDFM